MTKPVATVTRPPLMKLDEALEHERSALFPDPSDDARFREASLDMLPDDTSRAARQLGRAAGGITDNPQLFIYGSGRIPPGPGEAGFAP